MLTSTLSLKLLLIAINLHLHMDLISTELDNVESQKRSHLLHLSNVESEHSVRQKRYVLYEINPGEGFNLRRDIYIRIAPLIYSLNKKNPQDKWILVLPPWTRLPHWRNTPFNAQFPWKMFFNLDKIIEYIPAIEFNDYLEEYGLDNPIDIVYQLQHFPFDDNNFKNWKEEIQTPIPCEDPLGYQLDLKSGLYRGFFWNHKGIFVKDAQCMALRGQASTLHTFLKELNPKSVMLDRAEVILWDHYGGEDWWKARLSLQFAQKLKNSAKLFLENNNLRSSVLLKVDKPKISKDYTKEFIAVHLRRQDFLAGRMEMLPTIQNAASQIAQISSQLSIFTIFLATDANYKEIEELENELQEYSTQLQLIRFTCKTSGLSDGECAIVDQILCSYSNYFIGTEESTFTFRIFEEREILKFAPSHTYNYFCRTNKGGDQSSCKKPTQWPIPFKL